MGASPSTQALFSRPFGGMLPAMNLPDLLLALMTKNAPPGYTVFSVAPVADCAPFAESCDDARWSDLYGWVRKENAAQAVTRYRVIATALADEARALLCVDADGVRVDRCVPDRGATGPKRAWSWTVRSLTLAGLAAAQLESGFREDVHAGRGRAKHPSEDGGQGRGPSGEACLIQAHPVSAWRFADTTPELKARAEQGDVAAREEIARSLVGTDYESTRRCWRVGLRMLMHARRHCEWLRTVEPTSVAKDWTFAMFSLYGTGTSCIASNDGKTARRESALEAFAANFDQLARAQARSVSGGSSLASLSSSGP